MAGGELPPAGIDALWFASSETERKLIDKELRENGVKVNMDSRGFEIFKFIGFEMEMSRKVARGRFVVSERSSQPFGVLHGGTTAHIAEGIASTAGVYATKGRVAGIEMNVNHLRAVQIGQEVTVIAKPLMQGSRVQVWEVKFETDSLKKAGTGSNPPKIILAAVCRLTLIIGLPVPDSVKVTEIGIKSKM